MHMEEVWKKESVEILGSQIKRRESMRLFRIVRTGKVSQPRKKKKKKKKKHQEITIYETEWDNACWER